MTHHMSTAGPGGGGAGPGSGPGGRFCRARRRRARCALDEDLVVGAEADLAGLDAHAASRRQGGFRLPATGRVVAVRPEHDPFLGVVREQGDPKRVVDAYLMDVSRAENEAMAREAGAIDRPQGVAPDVAEAALQTGAHADDTAACAARPWTSMPRRRSPRTSAGPRCRRSSSSTTTLRAPPHRCLCGSGSGRAVPQTPETHRRPAITVRMLTGTAAIRDDRQPDAVGECS